MIIIITYNNKNSNNDNNNDNNDNNNNNMLHDNICVDICIHTYYIYTEVSRMSQYDISPE